VKSPKWQFFVADAALLTNTVTKAMGYRALL
jgi:hypothetical protein